MKKLVCLATATGMFFAFATVGSASKNNSHGNHSKYAGQENRTIKSLSPDDIVELKRGGGWGLAKAAELNGVPGPAHLLELKDAIPLNEEQVSEIEEIYRSMKSDAIREGERLIALERTLETHFRSGAISPGILQNALADISASRMKLRYIHLSTHLRTPQILSKDQIDRYNTLRGYDKTNPCDSVPAGHDPELWRKHNGCN